VERLLASKWHEWPELRPAEGSITGIGGVPVHTLRLHPEGDGYEIHLPTGTPLFNKASNQPYRISKKEMVAWVNDYAKRHAVQPHEASGRVAAIRRQAEADKHTLGPDAAMEDALADHPGN
jgi:hypothetical protein